MFHLIKKYPNRKMYDISTKKFVSQEELVELYLMNEEIRIEDSDTHIDITNLELSKALMKFKNSKNIKDKIKLFFDNISKSKKDKTTKDINNNDEIYSYIPAEIRLLNKSLEYLYGAKEILTQEPTYNSFLKNDLLDLFNSYEKKLVQLKKKYKIL